MVSNQRDGVSRRTVLKTTALAGGVGLSGVIGSVTAQSTPTIYFFNTSDNVRNTDIGLDEITDFCRDMWDRNIPRSATFEAVNDVTIESSELMSPDNTDHFNYNERLYSSRGSQNLSGDHTLESWLDQSDWHRFGNADAIVVLDYFEDPGGDYGLAPQPSLTDSDDYLWGNAGDDMNITASINLWHWDQYDYDHTDHTYSEISRGHTSSQDYSSLILEEMEPESAAFHELGHLWSAEHTDAMIDRAGNASLMVSGLAIADQEEEHPREWPDCYDLSEEINGFNHRLSHCTIGRIRDHYDDRMSR